MFWDGLSEDQWKGTSAAAAEFGLQLVGVELRDQPYDYEKALAQAPSENRNILIMAVSPTFYRDRQRLAEFALRKKVATMFGLREWVQAGGLISYGVNFPDIFRRAADYVDGIAAPFVDKFIAPASRKKMVAALCAEYIAAHCHGRASRPTACPIRWAGACHRQQATKVPMTDFPTRGQSKGLHGCSLHRSTSP
jgi:hypothetical protein